MVDRHLNNTLSRGKCCMAEVVRATGESDFCELECVGREGWVRVAFGEAIFISLYNKKLYGHRAVRSEIPGISATGLEMGRRLQVKL